MISELMLMTVAGIVMVALLAHRHLELSRGLETRAQDMREKADPILRNFHHSTGRMFSYFTVHNFVLVLNYAFVHVVKLFMELSHSVHKASSNIVEKASKKTEDLSKGGAASFYLKQIKETKDSSQIASQSTTETKEL